MDEPEKLKHLLKHWKEHNEAHVKTYDEWVQKTDALGKKELSAILKQIAEESTKLDGLFIKALKSI